MADQMTAFPNNPYAVHARCQDCDWTNDDYKSAEKSGRRHVIKTGHTIQIEEGRTYFRTSLEESGSAAIQGRRPTKM